MSDVSSSPAAVVRGAGRRSAARAVEHRAPGVSEYWKDQINRVKDLSERELDVFIMLGAGKSNRAMAKQLDIAERTVKAHVTQILSKLDVESRLQAGLVSYAFQLTPDATVRRSDPGPLIHPKSA
ncbi:response regulator transcription factor [Nocardia stercoris]|nr:LuxR C-terminal-related transcriptional regulator [Nocardia stercoris]